jgi:hypothetical protein
MGHLLQGRRWRFELVGMVGSLGAAAAEMSVADHGVHACRQGRYLRSAARAVTAISVRPSISTDRMSPLLNCARLTSLSTNSTVLAARADVPDMCPVGQLSCKFRLQTVGFYFSV